MNHPQEKGVNQICLNCGQHRESIKRNKTYCATVTYEGETDQEWSRHRFKPYSENELARIKSDEDAYIKQMGGFADFVEQQEKIHETISSSNKALIEGILSLPNRMTFKDIEPTDIPEGEADYTLSYPENITQQHILVEDIIKYAKDKGITIN